MKRVCAWCGQELDPSENRDGSQVTHGLCQVCRRRFFASTKAKELGSRPGGEGGSDDSGKAGVGGRGLSD